jgi:hypothetical protein
VSELLTTIFSLFNLNNEKIIYPNIKFQYPLHHAYSRNQILLHAHSISCMEIKPTDAQTSNNDAPQTNFDSNENIFEDLRIDRLLEVNI